MDPGEYLPIRELDGPVSIHNCTTGHVRIISADLEHIGP